jgi:hypothetical protein
LGSAAADPSPPLLSISPFQGWSYRPYPRYVGNSGLLDGVWVRVLDGRIEDFIELNDSESVICRFDEWIGISVVNESLVAQRVLEMGC